MLLTHTKVVSGYIWRYAMSKNAKIFFRGIRTWEKDGEEERALHKLNLWGPLLLGPMKWPLPTYYLEGNPKYTSLSSTLIRDKCKQLKLMMDGNDNMMTSSPSSSALLNGLVPKEVESEIANAYACLR